MTLDKRKTVTVLLSPGLLDEVKTCEDVQRLKKMLEDDERISGSGQGANERTPIYHIPFSDEKPGLTNLFKALDKAINARNEFGMEHTEGFFTNMLNYQSKVTRVEEMMKFTADMLTEASHKHENASRSELLSDSIIIDFPMTASEYIRYKDSVDEINKENKAKFERRKQLEKEKNDKRSEIEEIRSRVTLGDMMPVEIRIQVLSTIINQDL